MRKIAILYGSVGIFVFAFFIALFLLLWYFADVFGQQLVISALAKHSGKCIYSNLAGNKS